MRVLGQQRTHRPVVDLLLHLLDGLGAARREVGDGGERQPVHATRLAARLQHALVDIDADVFFAAAGVVAHALHKVGLALEDFELEAFADAVGLLAVGVAAAIVEWRGCVLHRVFAVADADVEHRRFGFGRLGILWRRFLLAGLFRCRRILRSGRWSGSGRIGRTGLWRSSVGGRQGQRQFHLAHSRGLRGPRSKSVDAQARLDDDSQLRADGMRLDRQSAHESPAVQRHVV